MPTCDPGWLVPQVSCPPSFRRDSPWLLGPSWGPWPSSCWQPLPCWPWSSRGEPLPAVSPRHSPRSTTPHRGSPEAHCRNPGPPEPTSHHQALAPGPVGGGKEGSSSPHPTNAWLESGAHGGRKGESGNVTPGLWFVLRKRRGTGYTEQLQQYSSPGVGSGSGKGVLSDGAEHSGQGWVPLRSRGTPRPCLCKWAGMLGCMGSLALYHPRIRHPICLQGLG